MFDYMKLQIEVLKSLNKEETADRVRVCIDDLDVLIAPDGYRAYRIPAVWFYLDPSKMQTMNVLKNVMNTEHGQEVQLTQDIKLSENGKDKLLIFAFADGKQAYIKEKYINTILPKLNAKHYYHFYMESPAAALKVFEDDICVAVFMPIVLKK